MSDPNILLIVMDCVRASNTSLYDYDRETTPYLQKFHENHGTLFEHAWAPSTWSLPSHSSLFSGYDTVEHGVTSSDDKLDPSESIFYELGVEGYSTKLFTDNLWVSSVDVGLKDSFDEVEKGGRIPYSDGIHPKKFVIDSGKNQYTEYLKECLSDDKTMKSVINGLYDKFSGDFPSFITDRFDSWNNSFYYVDQFDKWVGNTEGNWAACINFMDAHIPYKPKDEYDKWSDEVLMSIHNEHSEPYPFYSGEAKWWKLEVQENIYDGCIYQVDQAISKLVHNLKDRDEFEDTYIVITADHGEGFGDYNSVSEHRTVRHNPTISDSVLRVPLLTKEPNQEDSRTVSKPATLTNYKSTVLSSIDDDPIESEDFLEDTVIASHNGVEKQKIKKLDGVMNGRNIANEKGRAAYFSDDGSIIKLMNWEDRNGFSIITNGQKMSHERFEKDIDSIFEYKTKEELYIDSIFEDKTKEELYIDSIFEDKTKEGLDISSDSKSEISEDTKDKLEDLGYM